MSLRTMVSKARSIDLIFACFAVEMHLWNREIQRCNNQPRSMNEPALLTADVNLGKEICFLCPPSYVIYFFQQYFFFFCFYFFYICFESVSWASAVHQPQVTEYKNLSCSQPICQVKMSVRQETKENAQWQGCMGELVLKNDAFKREKNPQLQLSGQNNTYYARLYVVATTMKKL